MRKKVVRRWRLDGKIVPKGTPGAIQDKKGQGDFIGYIQTIGGKDVYLGKTLTVAKAALAEKMREAEYTRRGVLPAVAAADSKLADLVDAFLGTLHARSAKHQEDFRRSISEVVDDCHWTRLSDATQEGLEKWLARKRAEGGRFSIGTQNNRLAAWRAFGRWLAKTDRVLASPFRHIRLERTDTDRRLERRPFTVDELAALVESVPVSPRRLNMTGTTRAVLYRLAAFTGLRAAEIASLRAKDFRLDESPPVVVIGAKSAKNKRQTAQPIPAALVPVLRGHLNGFKPDEPVFPLGTKTALVKLAKVLRRDCAEALEKIESAPAGFLESAPGAALDFHSLRGSFATILAGTVSQATLGKLARHAAPSTTLRHYAKPQAEALAAELERAFGESDLCRICAGGDPNKGQQAETLKDQAREFLGNLVNGISPEDLRGFAIFLHGLADQFLEGSQGGKKRP
jgi:integrase